MNAKAPARGTGKLVINFGMINVPIDVYNGVDEDANKISRNMRTPQGNAVTFQTADAKTGELLSRSETHYVVSSEDGTEVKLSDEEIEKAMAVENGSCELLGFYDTAHLGSYVTRQVYQVRPQTVKSGKKTTRPYDKSYALLIRAMRAEGKFALLRYVMRGKLHIAGLLADGTMLDFYWQNEIREELPMPEVELSEKEVGLAALLVAKLSGEDAPPALENTAVKAVRDYIETKARDGEVAEAAAPVEAASVIDSLEALLAASIKG